MNHVANTIAVMFRREVLEQLGGFKPACSPAEDYELLLRAARLFPSRHHRTVVAQYRRHADEPFPQGHAHAASHESCHATSAGGSEGRSRSVVGLASGQCILERSLRRGRGEGVVGLSAERAVGGSGQGRRSADSICRVSDPCLALETPTPAPKPSAPESRRSRKGRADPPGDASSGGGQRAGACE